jgi:uncharacterized membrane protein
MMEIKVSIDIDRPPGIVWRIMADVEHWPAWTPTVTEVKPLDSSTFGLGSRVRVSQPRLKPMVWQVSQFSEGGLFTWEARSPGFFIVATHEVRASARGSIVTLTLRQTGPLAPLVSLLFGKITRQYVHAEAEALKKRSESVTLNSS